MKRILVVDDEVHILLMLKKMLERAGYEVDIATNGREGLELFSRKPSDLVVTDIIMPEKEGLETIREIRKISRGVQIIAMSGGGKIPAEKYLETARLFGAARVFEKPFSQSDMISAVRELLGDLPSDQEQGRQEGGKYDK
jgi:DNA-binding NtrC family response regulator